MKLQTLGTQWPVWKLFPKNQIIWYITRFCLAHLGIRIGDPCLNVNLVFQDTMDQWPKNQLKKHELFIYLSEPTGPYRDRM